MEIEELRAFCLSMPGTTEDMKWGDNLTFMVHEKIFALFSLDATPIQGTFKVSQDEFDKLIERVGFYQAPYFAKRQWVRLGDLSLLSPEEWKVHLAQAYELIKAKLPKKIQAQLTNQ